MNLEIIPVYKNLDAYIEGVENGLGSFDSLWEKFAIEPYWKTLCQYAPFDISERKPKPVTCIPSLKKQIILLNQIDLGALKSEFEKAASALPMDDDGTIHIALYPLPDEDAFAKEKQNGVVGTSTFGHMLIAVNPLAEEYLSWIPYVFAHEYHHTVWGNYWYAKHGGELEELFINALLIDGEADSFALSLYPEMKPKWLFDMTEADEKSLWREHYSKIVLQRDVDYGRYMFGDASSGIPWCTGYAVGYRIVRRFLEINDGVSFGQLLKLRPLDIYGSSGYGKME
jgi:uncharacterized protein YjaZ